MKVRGSCVIDAASRNPTKESCSVGDMAALLWCGGDYLLAYRPPRLAGNKIFLRGTAF